MHRLASQRLRQASLISTRPSISISISTQPQLRHIAFRHPHSQHHPHHASSTANHQPVRFQKPSIFSRKRQLSLAIYLITSVAFYKYMSSYITIEVEVEDLKEEEEEEEKKKKQKKKESGKVITEEGDEDDEESIFIPMTWGKKLPREFYRGSDPEWQEFVKIAKDRPRHKKIQDALILQIFSNAKKHPGVQHHVGKDLKVGKYWLDISFPDGPPQEYQRYGVEIGESGIYWSSDHITPEEQFRLERALWPVAVFNATWAASKAVGGIHYRKIKQYLGVEGVDPFSPEERLRLALETAEEQHNAKNQKGKRGSSDIDPAGALVSRSSPTGDDRPSASSSSSDETKRFPWQLQLPMPSSTFFADDSDKQSMDLPIFQIVFQTTLQKFWQPKRMEPPRGSFVVQGMMEVRGSKGQILFDVKGAYDPTQGKYVMVQAQKRNYKLWNQRPKGGP